MESETQKNTPQIQPLPLTTPPVVPPSANWSKILFFVAIGLIVAVGAMFISNQVGKKQVTKVRLITEKETPTSVPTSISTLAPSPSPSLSLTPTPLLDTNQDLKCPTEITCPNDTFCDYSTPGGMGPNGFVSGQPYGSQQCISRCQDDSQCPNGRCQTFQIVGGDIVIDEKGCVDENDLTYGIHSTECCPCPKKIRKSLIGTGDWVKYEQGMDRSNFDPHKICEIIQCRPCP